jgi:hypothetical protein
MLGTAKYRKLIDACAELVGLPEWEGFKGGEWLEGVMLTESSGNPQATRYEPHQDRPGRRDSHSDADAPGVDDGMFEDDKSYGPFQVMGYNVKRLVGVPMSTRMNFSWVLLPIANISLALRILLDELRATGGHVAAALARYNGGPTGDDLREVNGEIVMRREEYVKKVRMNTEKVARDRM